VIRAIGAQHKEAIVAGFVGELAGIDLEGGGGLAVSARHPAQVAAVGGVADQRLVAARQLLAEPGDDGLSFAAVAFRFGLVATHNVARRAKLDLLDEELGLASCTFDQQRRQRLFVLENEAADDGAAALAATENVFELALLQRRDRRGRDHAAVGDNTDPADMEALAQTVDDRQPNRHIGGVAGQHLGANRPPFAVDDDGQDHLLQVRPMVLRVAMRPQTVTVRPAERQTGRVHEDQRQVAEQIAAPFEQALLDQVLDAARCQSAGRAGAVSSPSQAKPSHRSVEVMQLQPVNPCYAVIDHPFVAAAVRARHKQPVHDTGEDRALDGKLKGRGPPATPPAPAAMSSRSQIRQNSSGPPMRVQAIRSAAMSDRMTAQAQHK
jgi:hypothetical protein